MARTQESVKVAAVQAAPVAFDLTATLKKVETLTAEAASQGAELVAFPEAFISAYPWRYAFGATVGYREPEEFEILENIARGNKVNLSIGIVEKAGSTLYCTAVLIGTDGTLLSRHRKA
ncbi:hypothetical protein ACEPPN_003831 [Leptodophora sp. 'Broadleaf-Isolate-01']